MEEPWRGHSGLRGRAAPGAAAARPKEVGSYVLPCLLDDASPIYSSANKPGPGSTPTHGQPLVRLIRATVGG